MTFTTVTIDNGLSFQSKWQQYVAGITSCICCVSAGAWFTWSAPLLPQLLAPDSPVPLDPEMSSWIVSSIEIGTVLGIFPATYLGYRFGRKISLLLSTPFFLIGFLLTIVIKNFLALFFARLFLGLGSGFCYNIGSLYLGEIASPEVRGTISGFFHLSFQLGCLITYIIGPHMTYESLTYAVFSLNILFVMLFFWQPESPYYYVLKNNIGEATKALKRLRGSLSDELIEQEIQEIKLEVTKGLENAKASWNDLLATRADKRALVRIIIVGFVAFFTGQMAMLSYSTETFTEYPTNLMSPDNVTIWVGVMALVGSALSLYTTDALGRRKMLLISSLGCSVSLFVASAYFYLAAYTTVDVSPYSWTAPVAVMACNLFTAGGLHPVCVSYTSELFPTKTRGMASCVSSVNLSIWSFVSMKLYITVALWMGLYFTYLCFGISCLVGFFVFYLIMPETSGKTFIQIREELMSS